jgi:phage-related holin
MKEVLKEVFDKVELSQTIKTITDKGVEKLAASAVAATVWDLGTIYALLVVLIVIDIFTHCIYEASRLYKNMYGPKIVEKRGSLLTYIKYLNHAHKFHGYIDSFRLRDGFWSKVICYFLLICVAFTADQILRLSHIPQFTCMIFCGVLACTEVLSSCENLNNAGIAIAGEIRGLISKRKEGIK